MTSSNGNIFRVTGPLCGEFTGHRWLPAQRPVTRSFDVFFDLLLNKHLSKQSLGWWFQTPSCPLWCHCNVSIHVTDCTCILPSWKLMIHMQAEDMWAGSNIFTLLPVLMWVARFHCSYAIVRHLLSVWHWMLEVLWRRLRTFPIRPLTQVEKSSY